MKKKILIPLLAMLILLTQCKITYWNPEKDSLLQAHWGVYETTRWTWTGNPEIDSLVKKLPTDNWRAALACRNWSTDSTGQTWGTYIPDQYLYLSKKEIRILTAFLLGELEVTIKKGKCCKKNSTTCNP